MEKKHADLSNVFFHMEKLEHYDKVAFANLLIRNSVFLHGKKYLKSLNKKSPPQSPLPPVASPLPIIPLVSPIPVSASESNAAAQVFSSMDSQSINSSNIDQHSNDANKNNTYSTELKHLIQQNRAKELYDKFSPESLYFQCEDFEVLFANTKLYVVHKGTFLHEMQVDSLKMEQSSEVNDSATPVLGTPTPEKLQFKSNDFCCMSPIMDYDQCEVLDRLTGVLLCTRSFKSMYVLSFYPTPTLKLLKTRGLAPSKTLKQFAYTYSLTDNLLFIHGGISTEEVDKPLSVSEIIDKIAEEPNIEQHEHHDKNGILDVGSSSKQKVKKHNGKKSKKLYEFCLEMCEWRELKTENGKAEANHIICYVNNEYGDSLLYSFNQSTKKLHVLNFITMQWSDISVQLLDSLHLRHLVLFYASQVSKHSSTLRLLLFTFEKTLDEKIILPYYVNVKMKQPTLPLPVHNNASQLFVMLSRFNERKEKLQKAEQEKRIEQDEIIRIKRENHLKELKQEMEASAPLMQEIVKWLSTNSFSNVKSLPLCDSISASVFTEYISTSNFLLALALRHLTPKFASILLQENKRFEVLKSIQTLQEVEQRDIMFHYMMHSNKLLEHCSTASHGDSSSTEEFKIAVTIFANGSSIVMDVIVNFLLRIKLFHREQEAKSTVKILHNQLKRIMNQKQHVCLEEARILMRMLKVLHLE